MVMTTVVMALNFSLLTDKFENVTSPKVTAINQWSPIKVHLKRTSVNRGCFTKARRFVQQPAGTDTSRIVSMVSAGIELKLRNQQNLLISGIRPRC